MSLWNDDRRYSDGEEYRQWKQEVNEEYRKEEYYDKREWACDMMREDGEDE